MTPDRRPARHRHWRLAVVLAMGLALAVGMIRLWPGLSLAVPLAEPAAAAWLGLLSQEVVREELVLESGGQELQADLYRPSAPRRALLLVHGLSSPGRRHPELVRLAHLLAARGHLVLVPHFAGLADFRLDGTEVRQIRDGLDHLRRRQLPLAVGGFSFGAGPAIIAAAEEPDVGLVAGFGGYADLRNVIRFVATGTHAFEGRRYHQPQEEYNRWKLLALLAGFPGDPADRARLRQIAEQQLARPGADTERAESALGDESRGLLALARARSEAEVEQRLERLSEPVREALGRLSPLGAVPRLAGRRLVLGHGADDPSIPFTESLRLARAAGGKAQVEILSAFHHTGPVARWDALGDLALDGWRLWRLADGLVRP